MKITIVATLILVTLAGRALAASEARAATVPAIAPASTTSGLEQGVRALAAKRYPEAVSALEKEARANPGSPEVLLNLGWAYWHAKRLDDALRVGGTLVRLDPQNRTFLVFLANTNIEKKRYREGEALARRALKQSPDDRDASIVLARALFLGGKKTEGLGVLDDVLARFPGDPAATFRKASFLADSGRQRDALELLDGLLKTDATNAVYRRSRAKILNDLGRQEEAKSEWRELTRRSQDAQSLLNLGFVYWKDKEFDAAAEVAATLIKIDDHNPTFLRFAANMQIEKMDYAAALKLAQRAAELAPGDRDAELTLSKALFRMQREREAMTMLQGLMARHPDDKAVLYRWAEFLSRTRRYDESLPVFERLVKIDPENQVYRLNRGIVLYEMGRFDDGLKDFQALAAGPKPNVQALMRLRDDAFNARRWEDAAKWQVRLIDEAPAEPAGWEKLARIYMSAEDFPKALRAAERAIEVDPVAINGWYIKGEVLERLERWDEAKAAYEDVVRRNPNSIRAYDGLAYALEAKGDDKGALAAVRKIEALTAPTVSPYLEVRKARLVADAGRQARGLRMLTKIEADRRTPIPVLLYHGVALNERSDAMPQRALREQLQALKTAGYEPMTVSELDKVLRGDAPLPVKPILITFDDGRTDSFENADPVLRELGWRATMFVHVSKLRKPHFHASPEDIAKWQATGRWEMQAHGSQAHDPMPIDGFGRKGHFLPNRMWLEAKRRLETPEEYRARVARDYQDAREGVEAIVPGHKVVAFAYPYGDYGQNDFSNMPESAEVNQRLVKRNFRLAFVQEQYGINTISSNPTDLRRFEVPRHMTAAQLVSRLQMGDPRVQARMLEAQFFARANQIGRAEAIYTKLEKEGIDDPRLWTDKGVAVQKAGDLTYARDLFSRAAAEEDDKSAASAAASRRLLSQSSRLSAPSLSAEVQHFTDTDTNRITKALLRAGAVVRNLRLEAFGGKGWYTDRRDPTNPEPRVESKEAGALVRLFLGEKVELGGWYARRLFERGATGFADVYEARASWQALPSLRLAVRDNAGNVETAAGIRAGRKFHGDGGGVVWDPVLNWKATADYDENRYNDGNREKLLRLRATRRLSELLSLGGAYFHGDSTDKRPAYYTPVALNQYSGIVTLTQRLGESDKETGLAPGEALLQYEGGYATQPTGDRWVHSVRGTVAANLSGRLTLSLGGQYSQSPTYISRRGEATATFRF